MDRLTATTEDRCIEIWQQVLEYLAKKLKKPSFETWIRPTKLISIENGFASIAVKNEFARNFIAQSFLANIQDALKEVLAASIGVRMLVDESIELDGEDGVQASIASITEPNRAESTNYALEQSFNNHVLNKIKKHETNLIDKFSFDNFIVAEANKFTHKFAEAIAKFEIDDSPAFISSASGLGKTHLINAIGNRADQLAADKKIRYINAEQFTNELVGSIRNRSTNDFRKKYRELDMLLVDDVQFFSGKDSSQEEFFHTFNSITHNGGQVIAAADRNITELTIEPRLKSRLSSGMTMQIEKPDFATRVEILGAIANEHELELEEGIFDFLAKRYPNNIRELQGAITRLNAYRSFSDETIDDELVVKLFGTYRHGGPFQGLCIDKISKTVADYFGISLGDLVGSRRLKDFTKARHVAVYLAYDLLNISYSRIGEYFSNRKHSSIIHSIKLIKSELLKDRSIALMIDDIKSKFSA